MTAATWTTDGMAVRRPAPRHGAWLVAGLLVAVLTIGFGGFDVAGLLSHEPVLRHHTWTGAVNSVDISVGNGSVTLVGSARPGAVVEASGARGLNTPSDHETLTGGRLQIRSTCPFVLGSDWCSLSYHLTVPRGVAVAVTTGSGSVHVSGVSGSMTLSSSDGTVKVDGGSGSLNLHSGDGNVDVDDVTSQRVQASSGDGDVTIGLATVPATVSADSGDGSVLIEVPQGPDLYQVDAGSGDGHVSTTVRTAPSSIHRIEASSGDGNVTVRYGSAGAG